MGPDIAALITRGSQSSFRYSFSFLPREQKEALNTVYAFCRTTDDIVDNENDHKRKEFALTKWRNELGNALNGVSEYSLLNKLAVIAKKFNIPVDHFYELIQGVEMDLTKTRYASFEELYKYCYLVASSVGLMSIKIFGASNERIVKYATNLGIALQLTNILRDLKLDAGTGRIYLPQDDMKKFNYSEEDLFNSRYTPEFVKLMEFEVERAEKYYREAKESLFREDKKYLFAPKIMERIYYHTLLRIKSNNYNVFNKSLKLPKYLQLMIAVKYLFKHKLLRIV